MHLSAWIGFIILMGLLIALDLGVFHRKAHAVGSREALKWSLFWITLGVGFSGLIYLAYENHWSGLGLAAYDLPSGKEALITYLTSYLIEKSLSLDNIFVMSLVFSYFRIPSKYQHEVLFWGILGAIFFRGLMIGGGLFLLHRFDWLMYVFGLILLYSVYKMWRMEDTEIDPRKNPVVNFFKKLFPVTHQLHGDKFFVRKKKYRVATPLFIALLVIETTDIVFAFDSVPAIFAITTDPFIVYSSNIFAILGLRALYFVLSAMIDRFQYLEKSLTLILLFIALKMLAKDMLHIPTQFSLLFILLVLVFGILYSLKHEKSQKHAE